jgi:hypothetical protein
MEYEQVFNKKKAFIANINYGFEFNGYGGMQSVI